MGSARHIGHLLLAIAIVWAVPVGAIPSWSFPGKLAIFARGLRDARPILAYNATLRFPAASVIKLVVLVGVVRRIDSRRLTWDTTLQIHRSEIVAGSESFGSVAPGTRATVRRLARAMISQSDNTAGNVLADELSFASVNDVAVSLGLSQTRLRRHFMDFAARARGIDNTTSAADMGSLLIGIERGARRLSSAVATSQSCRAILAMMLQQEDRDTIPAGIRRRIPIANKTGVLDDVRNDVAIIDPFGLHPYVLVLLSQFAPAQTPAAYFRLRVLAGEVDAFARSTASKKRSISSSVV